MAKASKMSLEEKLRVVGGVSRGARRGQPVTPVMPPPVSDTSGG